VDLAHEHRSTSSLPVNLLQWCVPKRNDCRHAFEFHSFESYDLFFRLISQGEGHPLNEGIPRGHYQFPILMLCPTPASVLRHRW
jgi:hypothetical protein